MTTRIFLIGISGTGKTRLSEILSKKLDIPNFDLDDIFWKKKYTEKQSETYCRKQVNKIMNHYDDWIINGTYSTWTKNVARRATQIIWLDFNKNLTTFRLVKRELMNKSSKKDLKSSMSLLKYQRKYRKLRHGKKVSTFSQHKQLVAAHKDKVVYIRNNSQLKKYMESIESV